VSPSTAVRVSSPSSVSRSQCSEPRADTNGVHITTTPRTNDGMTSTDPPVSMVSVTPNTPSRTIAPSRADRPRPSA
jgi:hypothetical protein